MKVIKAVLLAPFKLIHWAIVFLLNTLSTIILAVGSIVYGLGFFVKSPKASNIIVKELIKKIIENGK